jgi:hypothetical protein
LVSFPWENGIFFCSSSANFRVQSEESSFAGRREEEAKGASVKIKLRICLSRYIIIRAGPLAQLVEQLTLNQRVAGSSPSGITIENKKAGRKACLLLCSDKATKIVAFFSLWDYK